MQCIHGICVFSFEAIPIGRVYCKDSQFLGEACGCVPDDIAGCFMSDEGTIRGYVYAGEWLTYFKTEPAKRPQLLNVVSLSLANTKLQVWHHMPLQGRTHETEGSLTNPSLPFTLSNWQAVDPADNSCRNRSYPLKLCVMLIWSPEFGLRLKFSGQRYGMKLFTLHNVKLFFVKALDVEI